MKTRPRKKPYTAMGIRRIPCFRCGQPSAYQWQICADGNRYRGLCPKCDVGLNRAVLRYMGDAGANAKIQKYKERIGF